MGLTADQMSRLLAGASARTRANMAGVPPQTTGERRLLNHIDGSNLASARAEAARAEVRTVDSARHRGAIIAAGAPKTLEESGMMADGFVFDESQIAALHELIHGKHVCLIGPAGTGKTTLVKHALAQLIYGNETVQNPFGIRQLTGEQGFSIAVCAFTGIATQVITATLPPWLAPGCKTIHSLLEYKPSDEEGKMFVPTRNKDNKLDHDIIVIDEASMLGLDLWHNLVNALRPTTRVILIGDLNQLKPVADATFFAYALAAGLDRTDGWSVAELKTIHRQKEAAANKIIEGAHAILNGRDPVFDNPKTDPDWRFIGFELPVRADDAHLQIAGAVKWLMSEPTPGDPERPLFHPYKDLLLTAGNGLDENDSASLVQQSPLNGTLSRMIEPPSEEHPVYIIDSGRSTKRFAVGHRVMATKNESPAAKLRVTNGLTGRITMIENNPNWKGNRAMFGSEAEVMSWRRTQAEAMLGGGKNESPMDYSLLSIAEFDTSGIGEKAAPEDKQSSHRITVDFMNGASRTYSTATDVEGLQLAYAVTVHKAQGSQADTVIIICHQAVKKQLNREWLYTGVTRARRRVIMLYTRMGLSVAVNRQQIFGASLREKIQRYKSVMATGRQFVRLSALDVTFEKETKQNAGVEADDASENEESSQEVELE